MLADAGMGFKKEEANHNLDNNQRPDVMAANIVDGKSNRSQMAIDVSVANTLSAHRQDSQEKEIKKREKSKHTKYYDLGRAEDAVIVPAVVTSYGALGSDFKTLINKTKEEALRRGRYVPGLDPDFIPYWTQNIVCTAVKFLSLAAKRAVTHQREHHHGYTAPPHG
jgi:ribosomal protein L18E